MKERPTHPQLVASLAKPGGDIISSLTKVSAHLWHMGSCVLGEVAELVEGLLPYVMHRESYVGGHNIVEELGDIEFYLEGIRAPLGIQYFATGPRPSNNLPALLFDLVWIAGRIFDAIKKAAIYNKPLDLETLEKAMRNMDQAMTDVYAFFHYSRQAVLETNIDKLLVRYNGITYSDAAAQNRADKRKEDLEAAIVNLRVNSWFTEAHAEVVRRNPHVTPDKLKGLRSLETFNDWFIDRNTGKPKH